MMTKLIPPADCPDMTVLRRQIDALDEVMISLLTQRAGYIDRAVELKTANGWPARINDRVEEVVKNARDNAARSGLDPDMIERFWRDLVEWSIAREAQSIRET